MCDSCLREDQSELEGESACPALPPRDIVPTSSRVPLYERVGSFKRSREPVDYESAEGMHIRAQKLSRYVAELSEPLNTECAIASV